MKNIFKFDNSSNIAEKFKNYVEKQDCSEIVVDLSELNVFDAMKFIVLSSAYHYKKYPSGKMKCHVASGDIKNFASSFCTANLELV